MKARNTSLVVAAIRFPYLYEWIGDTQMGGNPGGIFHFAAMSLNITYKLVEASYFGDCDDNGCTGMLGMASQNEAHIAFGLYTLQHRYADKFYYGYPADFEPYHMISGMRVSHENNPFSVFSTMEYKLYAIILMLPLVLSAITKVNIWTLIKLRVANQTDLMGEPSVPETVLLFIGIQLNQGCSYSSKVWATRLIFLSSLISSMFLILSFSSIVKATMMMKQPTFRFDTLDKVAHAPNMRWAFVQTHVTASMREAKDGPVSIIYKRILKSGFLKLQDFATLKTVEAILNGQMVAPSNCYLLRFYFADHFFVATKTKPGYFYCSKDILMQNVKGWYYSKGLMSKELVHEFSIRTMWYHESPSPLMKDYTIRKVPDSGFAVDTPIYGTDVLEALTIKDIYGSLLIVLVGSIAALFLLFMELIIFSCY